MKSGVIFVTTYFEPFFWYNRLYICKATHQPQQNTNHSKPPGFGQNGSTTATFPFITSDNAVRNYGLSVHSLVATTLKFIPIIIREGLLKKDLQDAFSKIFCVSVTILLNDLNGNFSKTDLEEDGHIN